MVRSLRWPFGDLENLASLTVADVMSGERPVLYASHDVADEGWQFLMPSDRGTLVRGPRVLEVRCAKTCEKRFELSRFASETFPDWSDAATAQYHLLNATSDCYCLECVKTVELASACAKRRVLQLTTRGGPRNAAQHRPAYRTSPSLRTGARR